MFGFVSILVCARYARACAYARCLLHVLVRDGAGGVCLYTSARALRWILDSDLTAAPRPIPPARRRVLPLVCVRLVAIPQYVSGPRGRLPVRAGRARLDRSMQRLTGSVGHARKRRQAPSTHVASIIGRC